jgi:hypothetical protein
MKKFIIHIVKILITLLIVSVVLDFTYTAVYENSTPRTKFQYLRSLENTKVDYVFLGSSRVENGIDPLMIEKKTGKSCVNLGYQGSKIGDIYTVLQLLKSYNISSDTVFIQIDYIFENKGHSINLPYEMAPFVKGSQITKDYWIDYLGEDPSTYYVPFIRYCENETKIGFREIFANVIEKKTNVIRFAGYSPLQGTENQKNTHRSLPSAISGNNPFYDKIKRYGINNNIEIVFFCAPFCEHTKNLEYVKKLKTKIPNLYDFSNAIKEDSMFVNCFHLNYAGARKFTEIFAETVIKKNNRK